MFSFIKQTLILVIVLNCFAAISCAEDGVLIKRSGKDDNGHGSGMERGNSGMGYASPGHYSSGHHSPGHHSTSAGYQYPPPDYQPSAPGYGSHSSGHQYSPPGYQSPPPGYGSHSPGHEAPRREGLAYKIAGKASTVASNPFVQVIGGGAKWVVKKAASPVTNRIHQETKDAFKRGARGLKDQALNSSGVMKHMRDEYHAKQQTWHAAMVYEK